MAYISDKVKEIIVDKLAIDSKEVVNEAKLTDLGADSLDAVEIIMEIEQEFDLKVPDEQAEKLTTVGEIIEYLEREKPNLK